MEIKMTIKMGLKILGLSALIITMYGCPKSTRSVSYDPLTGECKIETATYDETGKLLSYDTDYKAHSNEEDCK